MSTVAEEKNYVLFDAAAHSADADELKDELFRDTASPPPPPGRRRHLPPGTRLLRDTSKAVGLPGIHDSTIYGSSRASTQSFFYHHLASTSSAVVLSVALTLLNHAANESFQLTERRRPRASNACRLDRWAARLSPRVGD